jgi:hypothetical protein
LSLEQPELEPAAEYSIELSFPVHCPAHWYRSAFELERKYQHHDEAITAILSAIRELTNPPAPKRRSIGFIADLTEKPLDSKTVARAGATKDSFFAIHFGVHAQTNFIRSVQLESESSGTACHGFG